jgi:O-antigen/teichoic acid export membrane protein
VPSGVSGGAQLALARSDVPGTAVRAGHAPADRQVNDLPPTRRALWGRGSRGAHAATSNRARWRGRSKASPDARVDAVRASRRAALTIVDQGVSSISNFVVSVAIARLDGAAALGAFALAYAVWQVAASLHRALVTDPMTVMGDAREASATADVRRGLAAEVLLGTGGAVILALIGSSLLLLHQHGYGSVMLMLAPWIPVLVVQDYWRWIGFMSRRPGRALANDIVFNCIQGGAFAALLIVHDYSIGLIIGAWGLGGLTGAVYGLFQYRVRPRRAGGLALLIERWHLSKWLAGDTLVLNFASQIYIVLAGVFLGPVGLGQLQAARTLVVGPAMMLIQSGSSAGLPEASRAFDAKGWRGLRRVSGIVTALAVLATCSSAVVVALFGRTILSHIYGPSFAHLQLVALLLAVGIVLIATELGPHLSLKATRNTRFMLYLELVNLVVTLAAVCALSESFGITGAACASVIRCGASTVVSRILLRRARAASRRPEPERMERLALAFVDGPQREPAPAASVPP